MESRRQEKFARLLQKDLGEIFQQKTNSLFGGTFITVSNVLVSPDLGYLKVYLSFLNAKDKNEKIEEIKFHSREIRKELAGRIKNQVRKIPEIEFFLDDSLDYVSKMEDLFKKIKEEEEQNKKNNL